MTFPCELLFCPQQTTLVSSANWITSSLYLYQTKNCSQIKKMTGPKTVACGTPWFTISQSENMPLNVTFCLRLARNKHSNSFAPLEKPYNSIFLREMELNAFARSKKLATVSLLWSKLEETVSTSSKTASVADFFIWIPICSFFNNFKLINEINHLSQKEALEDFCKTRSYRNWSIVCAICCPPPPTLRSPHDHSIKQKLISLNRG